MPHFALYLWTVSVRAAVEKYFFSWGMCSNSYDTAQSNLPGRLMKTLLRDYFSMPAPGDAGGSPPIALLALSLMVTITMRCTRVQS